MRTDNACTEARCRLFLVRREECITFTLLGSVINDDVALFARANKMMTSSVHILDCDSICGKTKKGYYSKIDLSYWCCLAGKCKRCFGTSFGRPCFDRLHATMIWHLLRCFVILIRANGLTISLRNTKQKSRSLSSFCWRAINRAVETRLRLWPDCMVRKLVVFVAYLLGNTTMVVYVVVGSESMNLCWCNQGGAREWRDMTTVRPVWNDYNEIIHTLGYGNVHALHTVSVSCMSPANAKSGYSTIHIIKHILYMMVTIHIAREFSALFGSSLQWVFIRWTTCHPMCYINITITPNILSGLARRPFESETSAWARSRDLRLRIRGQPLSW